jgi:predicted transcriptional regulator
MKDIHEIKKSMLDHIECDISSLGEVDDKEEAIKYVAGIKSMIHLMRMSGISELEAPELLQLEEKFANARSKASKNIGE